MIHISRMRVMSLVLESFARLQECPPLVGDRMSIYLVTVLEPFALQQTDF